MSSQWYKFRKHKLSLVMSVEAGAALFKSRCELCHTADKVGKKRIRPVGSAYASWAPRDSDRLSHSTLFQAIEDRFLSDSPTLY